MFWLFSLLLSVLLSATHGDIFEVSKVSFSSTVKESFSIPGISDPTPDPSCTFEAFLTLEPTEVKNECIKNVNNGQNKLALSGRLFIGKFSTAQVDALGAAGPELVLDIDCSEQNCNPGTVGGDDCKYDSGCSLLGVSTKDGFREMATAAKLQFQKNKWAIVSARLPSYTIEFNLSWVVEASVVVPTSLPPLTPFPPDGSSSDGSNNNIMPTLTVSGGGGDTVVAPGGPPDNTVTIVIASVVGLVLCLAIVLAIVWVVMRARNNQAAAMAAYPPYPGVTGGDHYSGMTPSGAQRSFTMGSESQQFGRGGTPSYTSGGYTGNTAGQSAGYMTGQSTGDAYGMMNVGAAGGPEAYGSMPNPHMMNSNSSLPPFGGMRSASNTFTGGSEAPGYSDLSFHENTGSAAELPDLGPPAVKPW